MKQLFKTKSIAAMLIACFCFPSVNLFAQVPSEKNFYPEKRLPFPEKRLSFEALTIDDGLSQGMINCIIQDKFGFMWFATKDGLNRFDGYHFVVYRHDVNNKNSLADNFANYIFEDSKGRLWICTPSQGLDLFDRDTETFIHFKHDDKNSNSICDNNIVAITENTEGVIFISTGRGICILNEKKNKNGKTDFSFTTINKLSWGKLYPGNNGTVWTTSSDNKFYRITGRGNGFKSEEKSFNNFASSNVLPVSTLLIQSIVHNKIHGVLYFIRRDAIIKYDERTGDYEDITNNKFEVNYITQPVAYIKGNIWIPDTRLLVFDTQTKTTSWIKSDDPKYDLMLNSTNCVYEDRSGNIWVGTSGYGLLKYNARADKFHHTDNVSIGWMREDNNGNILIVKRGDVVWVFDKKTRSYIKKLPDSISIANGKLYGGGIEAVLQDKDSSYWIAKQNILHYNEREKKFEYPVYNKNFSFPIYDDKNGMIWAGTNNSFCGYNKKTKQFTHYLYPVHTENQPYKFIEAIYLQSDSIFWLGTINGLFRFNKNTGEWKQFKNISADTSSLSNDIIFSLCADPVYPDKYLWVGTNGGGLNRFDFTTQKFLHYSIKDGLPNDVIYGILSDDDGNLWMSTNKGLSKFTPPSGEARGSFQNYETKDGLQSNEFNRYAFCKTRDGTLFFGGVNGFNYFNPRDLTNNKALPNVVITDFKIANKQITIQSKEKILQKPIYLTDKIVLKYEYNMISFDFAAMDFSQSGKNLYQYKLDGFDKEWIQSGTQHFATYTNLDPGSYTFHVKGSNSDGVWNEAGTSIQLIILPPWFMTWWFRTAAVIIILSAAYAFYRYRLSHALKLQAVRNRIASDLHDEIGSNLSNISIFSNVAQQRAKTSNEDTALLQKITEYTQVSMDAMSDIVWMINARNDRFENIIVRMRSLAAEIFEATNCTLHIHFDEKLNHIKLNMEERKNFYLIYKEAINNIAKYADCKEVWIEMKMHHNKVTLNIRDNGKGFDMLNGNKGNGLFNMQKRAEALKGKLNVVSNIGEGTLVELSFEV